MSFVVHSKSSFRPEVNQDIQVDAPEYILHFPVISDNYSPRSTCICLPRPPGNSSKDNKSPFRHFESEAVQPRTVPEHSESGSAKVII